MSTFNTTKTINVSPRAIPAMHQHIVSSFTLGGYDVEEYQFVNGGSDISIAKGNMFMGVLGMRTALKISLQPQDDSVRFEAKVGIFGQQAIPSTITALFFWPVLFTQIWGIIEQANLDDKALTLAESAAEEFVKNDSTPIKRFCHQCKKELTEGALYCGRCGTNVR